ncbi:hypothetical protein C2E20_4875 [Micractinium conductrix]|uniref:Uncharacterized protein n=1 Tax=Micractinium conductrix TaxID=554055 RepID=A0A2P6VCK7_9CHLO|nr:hypothetical protein C2E20_4875 [Micractinium conductrix]|eukprot:PSC71830.1 hypothetical protein C2E20_4875 [Micractinium conductrix]
MADLSPFAAFAGAGDGAFGSPSASPPHPSRVVGFAASAERAYSAGPEVLPIACPLAERQGSLGGLGALLRARSVQAEPEPPRGPRLSITTTRSLRVGTGQRSKRVPAAPRIQENAAEHHGSEESAGSVDLGSTAPSRPAAPIARAPSGNIDILPSARLVKAQTAPEGLADSLVLASIAFDAGASGCHSRSPQPRRRSSREQQQQQRGGPQRQGSSGSYRELFDAQAETAMVQAQVNGLQEALRRRNDDVEQLQAELARMKMERDSFEEQHRQSEAARAQATRSAMHRSCSEVPASAFAGGAFCAAAAAAIGYAVAGDGHAPAAVGFAAVGGGAAPLAAGPQLRLQARERGWPAHRPTHLGGSGSGEGAGGQQPRGSSHLKPAAAAEGSVEPPAPTMVSAFANHALPFSFE